MFNIGSLANVWTSVFYIVLALVVLLVMVTIHELGHYIAGRILKFKINEFAVGFGKVLWQTKNKRGEKISLRLFPLGGFCQFDGEEDDSVEVKPGSFNSHAPWKRIIVYAMGPLFNIVSAVLFSFILLVGYGYDIPKVASVDQFYVNASVVKVGDVIYEVDGKKIDFVAGTSLSGLLADYQADEPIVLTIKRDGKRQQITVQLQQAFDKDNNLMFDEQGNPVLRLGIQTTPYAHTFGEALVRAIPFTIALVWFVLKSLVLLFTFQIPLNQLAGPIGTVGIIANQAQANIASLLFLMPLIAANLGVFNLMPIPALDGSHIVFNIIEWIRKKPINRTVESYIHFFGFVALILFIVLLDIFHLVS